MRVLVALLALGTVAAAVLAALLRREGEEMLPNIDWRGWEA